MSGAASSNAARSPIPSNGRTRRSVQDSDIQARDRRQHGSSFAGVADPRAGTDAAIGWLTRRYCVAASAPYAAA